LKPFSVIAFSGIFLAALTVTAVAAPPTDNWRDDERSDRDSRFQEEDAERPYGYGRGPVREDYWARDQDRHEERRARYRRGDGRGMGVLRRYDLDGDGVISRQEFAEGTLRRFNRLDANGDGAIAEEEIATVRRRWAR
jgi:hypothetical protein